MAGKSKTRLKSDQNLIPIKDWEDADEFLRLIGNTQLEIRGFEDTAKTKIDEAKAELKNSTTIPAIRVGIYIRSLEAFAASHKDDFGKFKSRKLQFGVLGWRASSVVITAKDTLSRIKEVFKSASKGLIRTKEDPDKDALGKLTDMQLASVGAHRKCKDVFFAEPDLPAAVDYSETRNA